MLHRLEINSLLFSRKIETNCDSTLCRNILQCDPDHPSIYLGEIEKCSYQVDLEVKGFSDQKTMNYQL
jgi:hypothetical protein